MDLITKLLIITLAFVSGVGVITAQSIALSRIYKSWCWWFYSAAWLTLGSLQVWRMIQLPAAILNARAHGTMPDSLTWEQLGRLGLAFLFLLLVGLAQDRNRRDLRKLGI